MTYFKEWLMEVTNPRQVLLVEDSTDDCGLILRGSSEYNIQWTLAHSYREAINELEKGSFRLVVLDLNLRSSPSGSELFQEIKRRWPWVPVLVLSARIEDGIIDRLTRHGFVMFLKKPKEFDSLFFGELFFVLNIPKKAVAVLPESESVLEQKKQQNVYNI